MSEAAIHIATPAAPLWLLVVIGFAVPAAAAILGWVFGRRGDIASRSGKPPPAAEPGDATLNAMLALLGLLLAFSFGFALSRADARKVTQIEEAAAIGTAFLRADLLEEPGRGALRVAIGNYARTRHADGNIMRSDAALVDYLARTGAAQARLWPTALAAFRPDTPPAVAVLVASGVTEVLDAHTRRLAAGIDAVPPVAKMMVLIYASVALFFVGNSAALKGRRLTWRTFALSAALSSIMVLVVDFERPREGFVRADTTVMQLTVAEIDAALGME